MSIHSVSGHEPNPVVIFETLNSYQRSAALRAAIELDLFSEIARGTRTANAIAKQRTHRREAFVFSAITSSSTDISQKIATVLT